MLMKCYVKFLATYPYLMVLFVAAFSIVCCILPFKLDSMRFPTFQDPHLGFSTRNTEIARRHLTWENLQTELKSSRTLIRNPDKYLSENVTYKSHVRTKGERRKSFSPLKDAIRKTLGKKQNDIEANEQIDDSENSTIYGKMVFDYHPNATKEAMADKWHILQNFTYRPDDSYARHVFYEPSLCGRPDEKYAHIVITSANQENLFTFKHLQSLCKLENRIMNLNSVGELCISNTVVKNQCCSPWSIPIYIAKLYSRASCLEITEGDVNNTLSLLSECSLYYHHINKPCVGKNCLTPLKCLKYEAAFTIFNYLASTSFFPEDKPNNYNPKLEETIIFLPVSASTASEPLYKEVFSMNSNFEGLKIVAMDFGIKYAIFDEYLLRDAWFMGLGASFIFACVWMYTASIFLTFMTLLSIVFGLAITYFLYTAVYQIAFFPFMNVVSIIICLGVGADNAFIFCKMWNVKKTELATQEVTLRKILSETFAHTFKSMLVTSLTTAVAFWGSFFSPITAISCFSIFAGTAILVNFSLMISWFPACIVIWDQLDWPSCNLREVCSNILLRFLGTSLWLQIGQIWSYKIQFVINVVTKFHYFWIIIFTCIGLGSMTLVFIYPGLEFRTDADLQLLQYNHPFEQYDFVYKNKFWFQRQIEFTDFEQYRFPLRFVWGIQPVDNGNPLNPDDLGHLVYDSSFNMTDLESQIWLSNFCSEITSTSFFHKYDIVSLTSCFINTFANSMDRSCIEAFTNKDLSPCCNVSSFPFDQSIFDRCIVDEMKEVYTSPAEILYPATAGAFFSKEELPTIKVVVVEFESNVRFSFSFDTLNDFYNNVTEFFRLQMLTAPPNMKNGFFISDIYFYDLQRALKFFTENAILVSLILSFFVLLFSTLNPILSIMAIITITFSSFTTLGSIILLGWKLEVLEAIVISTTIGLLVDFSLHYCINYSMCPRNLVGDRREATQYALSCLMGPSFMAGFTTAISGFIMIFSWVLPYYQIGLFLVLIMTISWLFATFFLGSLLVTFGPINNFCQLTWSGIWRAFFRRANRSGRFGDSPLTGTSAEDLERATFLRKRRTQEPSVIYSATPNVPNEDLPRDSPTSKISIIFEAQA